MRPIVLQRYGEKKKTSQQKITFWAKKLFQAWKKIAKRVEEREYL